MGTTGLFESLLLCFRKELGGDALLAGDVQSTISFLHVTGECLIVAVIEDGVGEVLRLDALVSLGRRAFARVAGGLDEVGGDGLEDSGEEDAGSVRDALREAEASHLAERAFGREGGAQLAPRLDRAGLSLDVLPRGGLG